MDLNRPTRPRLWFALLGGMSAYAVHLVVSFWVVPALCPIDPGVVPWLVTLTTAVTLPVAVVATAVGVRARHRLAEAEPAPAGPSPSRGGAPPSWDISTGPSTARFLATTGAVLSGMGVVLVVFHGLPVLLVDPCV